MASALAAAALPVLSMNVESSSMEDVFLSVTQQTRGRIGENDISDDAEESDESSEDADESAADEPDSDVSESDDKKGDEE